MSRILSKDLKLPKTFEDAKKIAESLTLWIAFIDDNPLDTTDPMGSFGGHIQHHLTLLNYWFQTERVKILTNSLEKTKGELDHA